MKNDVVNQGLPQIETLYSISNVLLSFSLSQTTSGFSYYWNWMHKTGLDNERSERKIPALPAPALTTFIFHLIRFVTLNHEFIAVEKLENTKTENMNQKQYVQNGCTSPIEKGDCLHCYLISSLYTIRLNRKNRHKVAVFCGFDETHLWSWVPTSTFL